jgi:hypothetical protein
MRFYSLAIYSSLRGTDLSFTTGYQCCNSQPKLPASVYLAFALHRHDSCSMVTAWFIPEVPKLWGADGPLEEGVNCLYEEHRFILNKIRTQDKIYILVGTLLG